MTERERLIALLLQTETFTEEYAESARLQAEYKADYLLANGVVVLPCKIGEKLYDAGEFFFERCSCPEIYELQDNEITLYKRQYGEEHRFVYDSFYIDHDDIGKTVFLSRALAEKALAERSKT